MKSNPFVLSCARWMRPAEGGQDHHPDVFVLDEHRLPRPRLRPVGNPVGERQGIDAPAGSLVDALLQEHRVPSGRPGSYVGSTTVSRRTSTGGGAARRSSWGNLGSSYSLARHALAMDRAPKNLHDRTICARHAPRREGFSGQHLLVLPGPLALEVARAHPSPRPVRDRRRVFPERKAAILLRGPRGGDDARHPLSGRRRAG